MKKIINLLMICIMMLVFIGCGNTKQLGNYKLFGYTQMITMNQLDSICFADGLPSNLQEWIPSTFYDYETMEEITKMMYIKSLSKDYEAIYILMPVDTLFKITKRIGYNIED